MRADFAKEEIEEKYLAAYRELEGAVQRRAHEGIYTALGYTSNLDLICGFKAETLNALLAECGGEEPLWEMRPAKAIRTKEDLARSLAYYCIRGSGGEVDVEEPDAVKSVFEVAPAMGGTGVQAAMALAAIGCPSVVHLTDDSPDVCRILSSPFISAVSEAGCLIRASSVAQTHEQEIHFTVQFKKGDVIRYRGDEAVIPSSNRVMLTQVTVNATVPFFAPYFRWIEENAARVSSNVMSSFNCIIDTDILEERLFFAAEHVRRYREANPRGVVFFEDAHYHSTAARRLCRETIYAAADIVSINEEELKGALEECGFPINIEDIFSCVEGARFIRERFGVHKDVIVHTKDYAMYAGDPLGASLERALAHGNLMATAKAASGCYGSMAALAEVLKLPLSPKGLECLAALKGSRLAGEAILVPSRYIDKPRFTVGLGDSFIGGAQICFGL